MAGVLLIRKDRLQLVWLREVLLHELFDQTRGSALGMRERLGHAPERPARRPHLRLYYRFEVLVKELQEADLLDLLARLHWCGINALYTGNSVRSRCDWQAPEPRRRNTQKLVK